MSETNTRPSSGVPCGAGTAESLGAPCVAETGWAISYGSACDKICDHLSHLTRQRISILPTSLVGPVPAAVGAAVGALVGAFVERPIDLADPPRIDTNELVLRVAVVASSVSIVGGITGRRGR